jgi:myb proto-oncogene protein
MKNHNKCRFTLNEDQKLVQLVSLFGVNQWKEIAALFPDRSARQLRERWIYYLDPQFDKKPFSEEEDRILIEGHIRFGNRWKKISTELIPNRTDISLRNRFHQIQKGKTVQREIFPSIKNLLDINNVHITLFPLE